MPLAIRHRTDPAPTLTPLPGLVVRRVSDPAFMATLQGRTEAEMVERFAEGHRAYVAWLDGEPAAWGWAATKTARIGEVDAVFAIPNGERYLWNFVTLPAHRGRGIYPRLIDAIVRAESEETEPAEGESAGAERFWIAYAPENHASGAGIRKAGFEIMAELSYDGAGRPAVHSEVGSGGAAAAAMLGLPEVADTLAPCWRCARAGKVHFCAPGTCTCDYQAPDRACAA